MSLKLTNELFAALNDALPKHIIVNEAFEVELNIPYLKKGLSTASEFFAVHLENTLLSIDEKEQLGAYTIWLNKQLMLIAIHDNQQILNDLNHKLQEVMLTAIFTKQRWLFDSLISVFTSVLKQAIELEDPKEIEMPLKPTVEVIQRLQVALIFPKIVIRNEEQSDSLTEYCMDVLSFAMPHYCNMTVELGEEARKVIMQAFRRRSLNVKISALQYFTKYLQTLAVYTDEDTQFFLSIMQSLAVIYKDIPSWTQERRDLGPLHTAVKRFIIGAPICRMTFESQLNSQQMVASSSEILFHQLKNRTNSWYDQGLVQVLCDKLMTLLDDFDYSLETVESLKVLMDCIDEAAVPLLKFLILAEVDEKSTLNVQLIEMSPSWKVLHNNFLKQLEALTSSKITNSNLQKLEWVSLYFLLAVQVEFGVARLNQIRQGLHPPAASITAPNSIASQEPLMKFKDWSYNHISLMLFSDFDGITQKLLAVANQMEHFDAAVVRCFIDIFSSILKLSPNSSIVVTMKQVLVAVVASPFYKGLKDDSKFNKLAGFRQISELLPAKFKLFYESSQLLRQDQLQRMKLDAIQMLSQLEISRINIACWWLIENIIQHTLSQTDNELKAVVYDSFTNFIINNSDRSQNCIGIYEKSLSEMRDFDTLIRPLHNLLCLSGGNVVILELASNENIFTHFILCDDCELSSTYYPKDKRLTRWMALMKDFKKGLLVSPDRLQQEAKAIKLDVVKLFTRSNDCKMKLFHKIPALLNHSQDFKAYVENDKGKGMFEAIFVKDKRVLAVLQPHLVDILRNIQKSDFSDGLKKDILTNCFIQLSGITALIMTGTDEEFQSILVKLTSAYTICVNDENSLVKCFKIFLCFIVPSNSQVMGEASILALDMAARNGFTLLQFFYWHRTFIMQQLVRHCISNFFSFKEPLTSSFINVFRRLNFQRFQDMIPKIMENIISIVYPLAIKSPKLMGTLEDFCEMANTSVGKALEDNIVMVYYEIFVNQKDPIREMGLRAIPARTSKSFKKMLEKRKIDILIYYNKSQEFVMEVMEQLGQADSDLIAEDISGRFLGVLLKFEYYLTSHECERVIKRNVLLSLGDIIRLLGPTLVSKHCFKITTVLKSAMDHKSFDLSEICIKVWNILIRTCEVNSLSPILSTIFMSLEGLIEKYPHEVNSIYNYLVVENQNLLSRHISDLFFIEKTRASDHIKKTVLQHMESQKMLNDASFSVHLKSLLKHLSSENADMKIRVYCLQYLKELFQNNRSELNEMICGETTMDSSIEKLLHILINNCKSTTSETLQLATAELLGELGAIEPSLQQKNFSTQKDFPTTIHSEEFAIMALAQLCRSYQFKDDTKYIDALSLAIQQILKSNNVTVENRMENNVWLSIPQKMRLLMEPLINTSYQAKQTLAFKDEIVFLNSAQTVTDWVLKITGMLVSKIFDEDTKRYLECLKPSMKHNQHTTSMFLPYVILHTLEMTGPTTHKLIKDEFQFVFDVVLGKDCVGQKKPKKPLYLKHFDFTPFSSQKEKTPEKSLVSVAIKVAKMIFEVFDFLEKYRRSPSAEGATIQTISGLIDRFDLEVMAQVNFECGEYARAMIYLEGKIKRMKVENSPDWQTYLPFLANIYAKLGSPDSVEGIQAIKTTEWSLEEKILINNVTGNHQDSAACIEKMMQTGEAKIDYIQSILNSFISLDQPETALLVYDNMIRKLTDTQQHKLCNDIKAEPLWRLSRYDELDELLADNTIKHSTCWGVRCGKLLLKFREATCNVDRFVDELNDSRLALMKNLKISGNEQTAYGKNYREIVNLHLVSEFEKTEEVLERIQKNPRTREALAIISSLINEWNDRMEFVWKNVAIEEPIYCLHRIILGEMKNRLQAIFGEDNVNLMNLINGEIGNLWIKSTQLACKNKMYQQAQIYILNAEANEPKDLFIEKAKLQWIKGDQNTAFKILDLGTKRLLETAPSEGIAGLTVDEKKIYSKGKLMIACYNAEAVNLDFESNKKLFQEASVKGSENEKLFLLTAEYMDRHYSIYDDDDNDGDVNAQNAYLRNMLEVVKTYFKSMNNGSEYIFQSMPRFLSIWLDTTANQIFMNSHLALKISELVEEAAKHLPEYYFYTAISQLISRICHPSVSVFNVLKSIFVKILKKYPHQSLWYLIPMLKSSFPPRVRNVKQILQDKRIKDPLIINEMNLLIDKFMKMEKIVPQDCKKSLSMKTFANDMVEMLRSKKSDLMLPFQCNLQLTRAYKQNAFKFTDNFLFIHKFKDRIDVMASMQKPLKLTVICQDGNEYSILFKKNDDLRIDQRYMEFSACIKYFLHKDPESRHRQLSTRTYAVIPINEKCGLIEWVPNLKTYKEVIYSEYVKKCHRLPTINDKEIKDIDNMGKAEKIAAYRSLINKFYPALGDYFRRQFSTPQNFFNARLAFIRSTAVMSIVGYILGLGDRHCENILIDTLSGETAHVDFNMLFFKGETLTVPETVPFRLTHSMVEAMGALGIEGPFRKCCEIVLRVLQKERNTLISCLRPLMYDTLQRSNDAWSKSEEFKRGNERIELKVAHEIEKIEARLKGVVSKYKGSSGIALSTEGQVNFIISEATSVENLAAMYKGWMPWM